MYVLSSCILSLLCTLTRTSARVRAFVILFFPSHTPLSFVLSFFRPPPPSSSHLLAPPRIPLPCCTGALCKGNGACRQRVPRGEIHGAFGSCLPDHAARLTRGCWASPAFFVSSYSHVMQVLHHYNDVWLPAREHVVHALEKRFEVRAMRVGSPCFCGVLRCPSVANAIHSRLGLEPTPSSSSPKQNNCF